MTADKAQPPKHVTVARPAQSAPTRLVDAVLEINGLNDMLRQFGGKPLEPQKDPATQEVLPADQQLTLGNVLLNLVASMEPEKEPKRVILQRRVGDKIAEAMDSHKAYRAGTAALGILRVAATQNKVQYRALILGQVWETIGTGEPAADGDEGA